MKKKPAPRDPYAFALSVARGSQWQKAIDALKSLESLDFQSVSLQELVVLFGSCREPRWIEWLVAHGADLNVRYGKVAPLHAAIFAGSAPRMVECLLDQGAEIEIRNGQNQTPLLFAAYRAGTIGGGQMRAELLKIAKVLLERGANPNAIDDISMSPLDYASRARDEKLVALLFQSGALLENSSQQGADALGNLAYLSIKLLKIALKQRPFSTEVLTQALVTAVVWGKLDNAKLLVKSGADLRRGDPRANESFEVIAARSQSEEMIAWVKKSLAGRP